MVRNEKNLIIYLLVGILIQIIIGFIYPKLSIITGGFITVVIFEEIYYRGNEGNQKKDLKFLLYLILLCGMPVLVIRIGCFLFTIPNCTNNFLQATIFAIVYGPLVIAVIAWMFFRFPIIIRKLIKKK